MNNRNLTNKVGDRPEVEIIGLATIFGNVTTKDATRIKALLLRGEPCVAEFVHGSDGLGNLFLLSPNSKKKIDKSASEFLVEKVFEYRGEVSILALGPLTNLALAVKRDTTFASKVKRVVVLGGSFFALGNVNPAAEVNVGDFFPNGIYGDPEAADVVFTSGENIDVVGINITTQVKLKDADLEELKQSKGKHAKFVCDMCKFYCDWHVKSDGVYGNICVLILFLDDRQCFLNHFLAFIS
ncbi:hypothetical protein MTR67_022162 [Solanum verrucosum]|uniref:Inosine/uridine-preferring nucleoside hydrolase domain-containing protein n=1 Tax=Solanum verrucosum TaxID=315347 RepID=A0AAF0TQA7_SOLVR|nr:hypothetical protein MTR67_022162 [Solanum verrucosum]